MLSKSRLYSVLNVLYSPLYSSGSPLKLVAVTIISLITSPTSRKILVCFPGPKEQG